MAGNRACQVHTLLSSLVELNHAHEQDTLVRQPLLARPAPNRGFPTPLIDLPSSLSSALSFSTLYPYDLQTRGFSCRILEIAIVSFRTPRITPIAQSRAVALAVPRDPSRDGSGRADVAAELVGSVTRGERIPPLVPHAVRTKNPPPPIAGPTRLTAGLVPECSAGRQSRMICGMVETSFRASGSAR